MRLSKSKALSKFGLIILSLCFLIAFSKLNFDLPGGIPISGQSFAVLLVAIFSGPWWASTIILLYLLIGALGLPVFSGSEAGVSVLFGATSGYLFGFLIASWVVGKLGMLGWKRDWFKCQSAMFIGTVIILACGVSYLSYLHGISKAMEWGFYPFVFGAIVKILVGGLIPPFYFKYMKKKNSL